MAASLFTVSLQASNHPLWSGKTSYVVVPDREGRQAFLSGHEPVLLLLEDGVVQIVAEGNRQLYFHVDDGFASFDSNHLVIAVDHGEQVDSPDSADFPAPVEKKGK